MAESQMGSNVAFKAEYDVNCVSLDNANTKTFLKTVIGSRNLQLQHICGEGKKSYLNKRLNSETKF